MIATAEPLDVAAEQGLTRIGGEPHLLAEFVRIGVLPFIHDKGHAVGSPLEIAGDRQTRRHVRVAGIKQAGKFRK